MRRRQIWNRRSYKGGGNTQQMKSEVQKTPAELYEDKFGKKPHGRMKEATILEKLKDGEPK